MNRDVPAVVPATRSGRDVPVRTSPRDTALGIVREAAGRLCDPEAAPRYADLARSRSAGGFEFWPTALSSGLPSVALLMTELARALPGEGWDAAAHTHLKALAEATRARPIAGLGMHGGLAGVALTFAAAEAMDPRYRTVRRSLDRALAERVRDHPWRHGEDGVQDHDYDAVNGAAGLLGYLVTATDAGPAVTEAVTVLVDRLVRLAGPPDAPRWRIAAHADGHGHPGGHYDLGLAHGIAGPLAALALARRAGHGGPALDRTLGDTADWLYARRTEPLAPDGAPEWPATVPAPAPATDAGQPPGRPGWCYGGLGIARALWHTGTALGRDDLKRHALRRAAADHRPQLDHTAGDSPGLCHGTAGLLRLWTLFAPDDPAGRARAAADAALARLIAEYDPSTPLGYRDEERPGVHLDDPGFLTGVCGVLLSMLAAVTDTAPLWDRGLLID
ncbi:lanthionine synthetase C family protein [Streptomyces sp. NPDC059564]|uniref:lanthionine synthetase C family protein n=1 Tax=Streptomyces sp. NPDC059564 TaxID=3346865 RepID=UPI0036A34A1A